MSKTKRMWSVPVAVHDIPEAGRRFALDADHNVRAAIAKVAGLRSLARLSASFEVNRHGSQGLHVIGTITARARQTCVVSLEPIENEVEENVDLLVVPPPARSNAGRAEDVSLAEAVGDDAADVLVDGTMDLRAIVIQL